MLSDFEDAGVWLWLYPLYGVNALAKGRVANQMSPMDDDFYLVTTRIADYTSDAEMKAAADRLGVRYVLQVEGAERLTTRFNEQDQIVCKPVGDQGAIGPEDDGFGLVLRGGDMALYELGGPGKPD